MLHRLLLFALILLCLPGFARAELSQEGFEHARSAFLFAGRGDWDDAKLHAGRSGEEALKTLIEWQYLLDPDSGSSFEEITRFIAGFPHWPEQKRLRLRAEQALESSSTAASEVIAWFEGNAPISGVGKIALAQALAQTGRETQEKIATLIREAWINGDFEEAREKDIRSAYRELLTKEDDIARLDRLLWEEKVGAARRMLSRVPESHRRLGEARIALITNKRTSWAVAQVPEALRKDPGLIYDRLRWRARRDDDKGAREMLKMAPKAAPYPEKWWRYREEQVRKAIDAKDYALASELLSGHGKLDGTQLADAVWLKGWLELEFLNRPKEAYQTFYGMYSQVSYPVSRSRAAFWTGRAAGKAGERAAAEHWYNTAAAFPTTFYGQLASLERYGTAPLHIPAEPEIGSEAKRRFEQGDLARVAKLCIGLDMPDLAGRLTLHLIETAESKEDIALAAGLGTAAGRTHLSVRAAKRAAQRHGAVLLSTGYPAPVTPGLGIERPLILAVIRQESEFDARAKSSAGAMGLMQLRPSTAKETARREKLPYRRDRLYEKDYNITLGSVYLARLIENYDGSYAMALAAYNAGPGNVRKWSRQFGTPGDTIDEAINWIEKIPFAETRNYVQRVLENLEVYRYIEADGRPPKLRVGEDLVR